MTMFPARQRDISRPLVLFERANDTAVEPEDCTEPQRRCTAGDRPVLSHIRRLISQSGLSFSPALLLLSSGIGATLLTLAAYRLLSPYFIPLYAALGSLAPFLALERRCRQRTALFAADYPTMLLATASSIKVGLTPYDALERSVKLLPQSSLVRIEVVRLLENIRSGIPREAAVGDFAASIRLPDLALFRSALLLVLENGGRFSPTLTRLAAVSNNRAQLIRSALVSTASMRMTANILLCVAPLLVGMLAVRTSNYWETFFNDPVAHFLASAGIVTITCCYVLLRHLSNFKP